MMNEIRNFDEHGLHIGDYVKIDTCALTHLRDIATNKIFKIIKNSYNIFGKDVFLLENYNKRDKKCYFFNGSGIFSYIYLIKVKNGNKNLNIKTNFKFLND